MWKTLLVIGSLFLMTSELGATETETVRERFWVWSHAAGVYNGQWGLPGESRITPVEGARHLGVPNVIFVRYEGRPEPPFDEYAVPFRSLERVMWSAAGAGGATSEAERRHVLRLSERLPNMTGVFLDDFFHLSAAEAADGKPVRTALSREELGELGDRLQAGDRRLEIGVTLYTHQLDPRTVPFLKLCDVVSLWTWKAEELDDLEANFARFEELVPQGTQKYLGLYMWDFGAKQPMPVARMRNQAEQGLRWLRAGRIDGLIFLGTNLCDRELEAVEWTRRWIDRVGDRPLHAE